MFSTFNFTILQILCALNKQGEFLSNVSFIIINKIEDKIKFIDIDSMISRAMSGGV